MSDARNPGQNTPRAASITPTLARPRNDPELETLRTQTGFKELLSELEKKVKVLAWEPDFEAAKARAARENKDLFVYFTGSDWCYWCLLVRKEVFAYSSVLFPEDPEDLSDVRARARKAVDDGFTAIKYGWGSFGYDQNRDVAMVAAAREVTTSDWLTATGSLRFGLTSGASTPDNLVGAAILRLEQVVNS